jgi:hypothetical protein
MLESSSLTLTASEPSVPRPRKPVLGLPPHVHRVMARGKAYLYLHRSRGTSAASDRIRLPDDPNSPEFWQAYHSAMGDPQPKPKSNSVRRLIEAWKASPEWQQLGEGTRVNWELHLRRIEEAWGDLDVRGIRPKSVLDLRDAFADRPGAANNMLRCLSSMLSWSVPHEWREDNPCQHIEKLKGGDGYEAWSWEMIELVRDHGPA